MNNKIKFGLFKQKFVNYFKHFPIALLANIYYLFPSKKLKIIGVTGTDGKTTVVNLIHHILKENNYSVGMISTVNAIIGNEKIETGLHVTSPDPWFIQKILRKAVRCGVKYVILETTSHGLDQFRFFGIKFEIGILTNISHEHLDYHKNMSNYYKSKLTLFNNSIKSILNIDDDSYSFFKKNINKNIKKFSYGSNEHSDLKFSYIKQNLEGQSFKVTTKGTTYSVFFPFFGKYNVYNSCASLLAVNILGLKLEDAVKSISDFEGVEGRLQKIDEGQNIHIFVDFAHTPNALEKMLSSLSEIKPKDNKLIVVFGSAGKRDKEKRPMMGVTASNYADYVILTADDPRDEPVNEISQQIAVGCEKSGMKEIKKDLEIDRITSRGYFIIDDRKQALDFAINKLASKGDFVVASGKGHEKSLAVGEKEIPWSDREVIINLLNK